MSALVGASIAGALLAWAFSDRRQARRLTTRLARLGDGPVPGRAVSASRQRTSLLPRWAGAGVERLGAVVRSRWQRVDRRPPVEGGHSGTALRRVSAGVDPAGVAGGRRGATGAESSRAANRRWGWATIALGTSLLIEPLVSVGVVVVALIGRWWHGARARASQEREVLGCVPDTVDLLRLAVDAGLTVHLAANVVAEHGRGPLADALGDAVARARRGARLSDELERVRFLGPPVAPVVDALIAAERHGAPLTSSLSSLAVDARIERRRRAEERARRLPVVLLFPLVLCILPALGILTVVPLAGAALDGLSF